jgi:hypothetical protein
MGVAPIATGRDLPFLNKLLQGQHLLLHITFPLGVFHLYIGLLLDLPLTGPNTNVKLRLLGMSGSLEVGVLRDMSQGLEVVS